MWDILHWVLALLAALTGLAILLLALLHVRYRAAWQGEWTGDLSSPHHGSLRVEFGFPGFMRVWTWKPASSDGVAPSDRRESGAGPLPASTIRTERPHAPNISQTESVTAHASPYAANVESRNARPIHSEETPVSRLPTPDEQGTVREESADPHRARKSLFRFFTDRAAWAHLIRYGFRVLKLVHRLFRPRVNVAVGHPDPALLGRLAGKWYAAAPLLPLGDTAMNFRFQDRRPTLRVNVEGGFSALSLLFFGIAAFGVFPFFGLGRRAWRGWRQPQLTGWRAWAYRRIQSL